MNLSYWEYNAFFKDIDVAIIGSGIVGLSAAIHVKEQQPKLKVVVLERGFLPSGASTKNAGFGCFGSVSELLSDLEDTNQDAVFAIVEKRWNGLQKLRSRIGDEHLDYKTYGGFELFKKSDANTFDNCVNKINAFNEILNDITGRQNVYQIADLKINTFGFSQVAHLIENTLEGQLNTGRMMKNLIQLARSLDIELVNGFSVDQIHQQEQKVKIVSSEGDVISAKQVIVATNGFAQKLLPDQQVTPARNQVMVTTPIQGLQLKGCFHYDEGYIYFRNIDNRVLIGGARNQDPENETTSEFGLTNKITDYLHQFLQQTVLANINYHIDYHWSGIMGIGNTKKPIVQNVSPDIYVAVRLGGMGVAIGSLIGEEVAELILKKYN
ncbi:MAG: FAD-binding oxidoreductase [Bacteroidetes bacterium]|nr:FAD-binding oxidoreductase [Bacteroidota bacterium]